ncbi:hypothetical protein AB4Z39_12505 [Mycobacterium adipatum]|uniref:hypothetical protein n=1 Tax=Mycobacterium adipatum TaxID=1682113 RepID=UPI0034E07BFD
MLERGRDIWPGRGRGEVQQSEERSAGVEVGWVIVQLVTGNLDASCVCTFIERRDGLQKDVAGGGLGHGI